MSPAFLAAALQMMMGVPVSTSLNMSSPYERANVATASIASPGQASPTFAQAQTQAQGAGAALASNEAEITIRRGASISRERTQKGSKTAK